MNYQRAWEYIRKGVSAADSTGLLATTNSDWGNREKVNRGHIIPTTAKALLIAFIGDHASDPEDGVATIKLTAYRQGGPAQVIGTYEIVIGGQKVNFRPGYAAATATAKWAETITEDSNYWIVAPQIFGVLADNVACLAIRTYGAAYVTAEVTALGTGITLDVLMSPLDDTP
jgi:hypothetical protein